MGKKKSQSDHVEMVERITRQHAAIFVEELRERLPQADEMCEALEATGIMTWPEPLDERFFGVTRAQARFLDLQAEILERTLNMTTEVMRTAFLLAATEVIERERRRKRKS